MPETSTAIRRHHFTVDDAIACGTTVYTAEGWDHCNRPNPRRRAVMLSDKKEGDHFAHIRYADGGDQVVSVNALTDLP